MNYFKTNWNKQFILKKLQRFVAQFWNWYWVTDSKNILGEVHIKFRNCEIKATLKGSDDGV
jgi:hypothetical protein